MYNGTDEERVYLVTLVETDVDLGMVFLASEIKVARNLLMSVCMRAMPCRRTPVAYIESKDPNSKHKFQIHIYFGPNFQFQLHMDLEIVSRTFWFVCLELG